MVRILPAKGERNLPGGNPYTYSIIDKDGRGKNMIGGMQLCRINTTFFKDWLDSKLRVPQEDPGAWHVFEGVTEDYCNRWFQSTGMRMAYGHRVRKGSKPLLGLRSLFLLAGKPPRNRIDTLTRQQAKVSNLAQGFAAQRKKDGDKSEESNDTSARFNQKGKENRKKCAGKCKRGSETGAEEAKNSDLRGYCDFKSLGFFSENGAPVAV